MVANANRRKRRKPAVNYAALNETVRAMQLLEDPGDAAFHEAEIIEPADPSQAALYHLERAMLAILDAEELHIESAIENARIKRMVYAAKEKTPQVSGMG